jgi:hypothetical protein
MLVEFRHLQEFAVDLPELAPQDINGGVSQFDRLPGQVIA